MKKTIISFIVFLLAAAPLVAAIPCEEGCYEGANCCGTYGIFNGKGYVGCQDSNGNWHCPGASLGNADDPSVRGCAECICDSFSSCSWTPRNELCNGCNSCQIITDDLGKPSASSCVPREGCEIAGEGIIECLSFGGSNNNICCIEGAETSLVQAKCFEASRQNPSDTGTCYYGSQTDICDAEQGWTCLNSPSDTTKPEDCSFSDNSFNYYGCTGNLCGETGWGCGDPASSSTVTASTCEVCSNSACAHAKSYPSDTDGCWSSELSKCCIQGQTWKWQTNEAIKKLLMSQICIDGYYYVRSQGQVTYYLLDIVLGE